MKATTVSLREAETNFPRVKRKVDKHGEVVITSNGEPAYVIRLCHSEKPANGGPRKRAPLPDYYARLLKRQPKAMSAEETRRFWEDERGDR